MTEDGHFVTPERWAQIEEWFHRALECEPDERLRLLAQVGDADPELRSELESLLSGHETASAHLQEVVREEAEAVTPPSKDQPNQPPSVVSADETLTQWPPIVPSHVRTRPASGEGHNPGVNDRIGEYRLLSILGEGGMGIVYLAQQEWPIRRRVALKLIKPGIASPEAVARFEIERQALAVMEHPNIAHVYDAGTTDAGQPYFVMEYVPGPSITTYCDQNRLPNRDRLKLFRDVCLALHHAHQKGVIHLDIKPSNVLVAEQDGKPVPKVIDFGVAKAIDRQQAGQTLFTQHGILAGTPEYMSPEQANLDARDVDASSDVYSLGVLLYELLVGALPFDPKELRKKGLAEILRIIREDDAAPLTSRLRTLRTASEIAQDRNTSLGALSRQLSGELDWITRRAMEKDRRRRYNSPAEFASDIEHYLNNEPVIAGPPSRLYRLRKFISKHRWPVAAAAAVLVVLFAGLVTSTTEAARARRAEGVALKERDKAAAAQQAATRERDRALSAEQIAGAERNRAVAAEGRALEQRNRAFQAEQAASMERNRALAAEREALEQRDHALRAEQTANTERNRAVLEKQRADEESATATAVSNFLQYDLLAQAGPDVQAWSAPSADPNIKVRTALDRAAARVSGRFKSNPSIEAAIRHTIGRAYTQLGLYVEGQRQLETALNIQTRLRGPEDFEALTTMYDLAHNLFRYQRKYTEAEPLMARVLEIRSRLLGLNHPQTLDAMDKLGDLYRYQRKYGPAEKLLNDALNGSRRVLGENASQTIDTKNDLALVYRGENNSAQAEALLTDALEGSRRVNGEEHPKTLIIAENLAELLAGQRKYARAESLFKEVLEARLRVLGEEHSDTWDTLRNFASLYRAAAEPALAEPLVLRLLSVQRRLLGGEAAGTIASMRFLAEVYMDERKLDQADSLLREIPRASPASDARLGELRLEQHDYVHAEASLRQALNEMDKATGGKPSWAQCRVRSMLGESLVGQNKFDLAEPLVVSAYQDMSNLPPLSPSNATSKAWLEQAGQRIVRMYEISGNVDRAAEWRQRLKLDVAASGSK